MEEMFPILIFLCTILFPVDCFEISNCFVIVSNMYSVSGWSSEFWWFYRWYGSGRTGMRKYWDNSNKDWPSVTPWHSRTEALVCLSVWHHPNSFRHIVFSCSLKFMSLYMLVINFLCLYLMTICSLHLCGIPLTETIYSKSTKILQNIDPDLNVIEYWWRI